MKKQIDEFQSFQTDINAIKGGVKCPMYLISAVRSKDPATLRTIIKRYETYSPETALAVTNAANAAGIDLNAGQVG